MREKAGIAWPGLDHKLRTASENQTPENLRDHDFCIGKYLLRSGRKEKAASGLRSIILRH
jgi:hypothetical protein